MFYRRFYCYFFRRFTFVCRQCCDRWLFRQGWLRCFSRRCKESGRVAVTQGGVIVSRLFSRFFFRVFQVDLLGGFLCRILERVYCKGLFIFTKFIEVNQRSVVSQVMVRGRGMCIEYVFMMGVIVMGCGFFLLWFSLEIGYYFCVL